MEEALPLVPLLLGFAVLFVVRWALFTGIMWGLLRMQSLNYNWPGLLATTAVGSLAYFIPLPFVGAAVAFAVVYAGLKWVTQAEHTDLMFSIVIGNALMYVAGLWLLAAVLPDLGQVRSAANAGEGETQSIAPDFAGMLNQASNTLVHAAGRGEGDAPTKPGSASPAAPATTKSDDALKLKGITIVGTNGLALLQAGDKAVSVGVRESLTVPGKQGATRYICEFIGTNRVVLLVHGSNPPRRIELKLE